MKSLLCLFIIFIIQTKCSVLAFLSGIQRDLTTNRVSTLVALSNEKGIQLSTLSELTDHDAEGQRIALSITGWLDEEVSGSHFTFDQIINT